MATYEQLMDAARRADGAGDEHAARRFLELARDQRNQAPADKGLGQTVWENLVGDDDPTTQNLGEKVGSFLNKAGESMTMGLIGDEASAAVESLMPGVNYEDRRDHYRQQEEQFEADHPLAALTADIGGGMAAPLGALGAVGKGAGWLKRAAASGGATGLMSGLYGFAEGEGGVDARVAEGIKNGIYGAGAGALIPLVGAGIQKGLNARATSRAIKQAVKTAPSTSQLRQMGQAAYRAVDDAGVSIKPEAARGLFSDLTEEMIQNGLDDGPAALNLTPGAKRLNEVMQEAVPGDDAVPFGLLDQLRRKAGVPASNPANKLDQRLGAQVIEGLDDFVNDLPAEAIAGGNAKELPQLLNTARDLWSKMSRSQMIDDAIDASQNYVAGEASGLRNQFARILKNPKLSRGFSDAEKKLMRRVVNGSLPERIIHLAGGGLGQIAAVGGGFGAGGIFGALLGAGTGSMARKASEKIAAKNAEAVRAVVANGGLPALPMVQSQAPVIAERLLRQGSAAALN